MAQPVFSKQPGLPTSAFPTAINGQEHKQKTWIRGIFGKLTSGKHKLNSKVKLNNILPQTRKKFLTAFCDYLSTTGNDRKKALKALLLAKKAMKTNLNIPGDDNDKEFDKAFRKIVTATIDTIFDTPNQQAAALKKLQKNLEEDIKSLSPTETEERNLAEDLQTTLSEQAKELVETQKSQKKPEPSDDAAARQKQQDAINSQLLQMLARGNGTGVRNNANPVPETTKEEDSPGPRRGIITPPPATQLQNIADKFQTVGDEAAQLKAIKDALKKFQTNPEDYTNEPITDANKKSLKDLQSITNLEDLLAAIEALEDPLKTEVEHTLTLAAILLDHTPTNPNDGKLLKPGEELNGEAKSMLLVLKDQGKKSLLEHIKLMKAHHEKNGTRKNVTEAAEELLKEITTHTGEISETDLTGILTKPKYAGAFIERINETETKSNLTYTDQTGLEKQVEMEAKPGLMQPPEACGIYTLAMAIEPNMTRQDLEKFITAVWKELKTELIDGTTDNDKNPKAPLKAFKFISTQTLMQITTNTNLITAYPKLKGVKVETSLESGLGKALALLEAEEEEGTVLYSHNAHFLGIQVTPQKDAAPAKLTLIDPLNTNRRTEIEALLKPDKTPLLAQTALAKHYQEIIGERIHGVLETLTNEELQELKKLSVGVKDGEHTKAWEEVIHNFLMEKAGNDDPETLGKALTGLNSLNTPAAIKAKADLAIIILNSDKVKTTTLES